MALGIDVGGTFTDTCLLEPESGQLWIAKAPTTPNDLTDGILASISKALAQANAEPSDISRVLHGTTVATNAILESKGAKVALVTTRGFRDVLEIGRHDIPRDANLYSWQKPARPVTAERIVEMSGRIDANGVIIEVPDEADYDRIAGRLRTLGVESVAICLLNSYLNPEHEQRLAEELERRLPDMVISYSYETLPVFREYERSMTTVLNAYVRPAVAQYLNELERRLPTAGVYAPVAYMQSNGGVISRERAQRQAIRMALSGPAAGVIGARHVGTSAGYGDLISIDIGGTSADISLVRDGVPETTTEGTVGAWPVPVPMIDIVTIGAGGGSIASATSVGSLMVGPRSAGASPGPAAYGHGGTEPTVTDANLVLGRLPESLTGGLRLDVQAARKAIQENIAHPLGLSTETAAQGVLDIINNTMVGAIRQVSVERGFDPREFSLLPLGGAGALHAVDLAALLGMPRVIVPPTPGVLATLGLLLAEIRNDYARSVSAAKTLDAEELEEGFADLTTAAAEWLNAEGISTSRQRILRRVDVRYRNQGFELTVPVSGSMLDSGALERITEEFHQLHERLYTFAARDTDVEITTLRVIALGERDSVSPKLAVPAHDAEPTSTRHIWFSGEEVPTPVYQRTALRVGTRYPGPLVIEQADSTVLVPPGWLVDVDQPGNLIMEREDA